MTGMPCGSPAGHACVSTMHDPPPHLRWRLCGMQLVSAWGEVSGHTGADSKSQATALIKLERPSPAKKARRCAERNGVQYVPFLADSEGPAFRWLS